MLKTAQDNAAAAARELIESSLAEMNGMLSHELHRLRTLRQVNSHIRPEELELAEREQRESRAAARVLGPRPAAGFAREPCAIRHC